MTETSSLSTSQQGPACPFCATTDTELIALFGSQLLTSQFYCRGCHTVFEAVRHGATLPEESEDLGPGNYDD